MMVILFQFFGIHLYGMSALLLEEETGVLYFAEANQLDVEATTINQTNVAVGSG